MTTHAERKKMGKADREARGLKPKPEYATLDMRSGTSRILIRFQENDPVRMRADLAAARYLIAQATEALNVMEQNREGTNAGQRVDASPARNRRDPVAELDRGEDRSS